MTFYTMRYNTVGWRQLLEELGKPDHGWDPYEESRRDADIRLLSRLVRIGLFNISFDEMTTLLTKTGFDYYWGLHRCGECVLTLMEYIIENGFIITFKEIVQHHDPGHWMNSLNRGYGLVSSSPPNRVHPWKNVKGLHIRGHGLTPFCQILISPYGEQFLSCMEIPTHWKDAQWLRGYQVFQPEENRDIPNNRWVLEVTKYIHQVRQVGQGEPFIETLHALDKVGMLVPLWKSGRIVWNSKVQMCPTNAFYDRPNYFDDAHDIPHIYIKEYTNETISFQLWQYFLHVHARAKFPEIPMDLKFSNPFLYKNVLREPQLGDKVSVKNDITKITYTGTVTSMSKKERGVECDKLYKGTRANVITIFVDYELENVFEDLIMKKLCGDAKYYQPEYKSEAVAYVDFIKPYFPQVGDVCRMNTKDMALRNANTVEFTRCPDVYGNYNSGRSQTPFKPHHLGSVMVHFLGVDLINTCYKGMDRPYVARHVFKFRVLPDGGMLNIEINARRNKLIELVNEWNGNRTATYKKPKIVDTVYKHSYGEYSKGGRIMKMSWLGFYEWDEKREIRALVPDFTNLLCPVPRTTDGRRELHWEMNPNFFLPSAAESNTMFVEKMKALAMGLHPGFVVEYNVSDNGFSSSGNKSSSGLSRHSGVIKYVVEPGGRKSLPRALRSTSTLAFDFGEELWRRQYVVLNESGEIQVISLNHIAYGPTAVRNLSFNFEKYCREQTSVVMDVQQFRSCYYSLCMLENKYDMARKALKPIKTGRSSLYECAYVLRPSHYKSYKAQKGCYEIFYEYDRTVEQYVNKENAKVEVTYLCTDASSHDFMKQITCIVDVLDWQVNVMRKSTELPSFEIKLPTTACFDMEDQYTSVKYCHDTGKCGFRLLRETEKDCTTWKQSQDFVREMDSCTWMCTDDIADRTPFFCSPRIPVQIAYFHQGPYAEAWGKTKWDEINYYDAKHLCDHLCKNSYVHRSVFGGSRDKDKDNRMLYPIVTTIDQTYHSWPLENKAPFNRYEITHVKFISTQCIKDHNIRVLGDKKAFGERKRKSVEEKMPENNYKKQKLSILHMQKKQLEEMVDKVGDRLKELKFQNLLLETCGQCKVIPQEVIDLEEQLENLKLKYEGMDEKIEREK